MKEMLLSDDFARYRKKQIEAIVRHVNLFSNPDLREIKGALDMARKLIQLPSMIYEGDDHNFFKEMDEKVKKDIKEFQVRFVRSHILDE